MRIPDTPLLGGTILTLDDLSARQAEIQQVSDLWADEQSRQLFRSLLEAKLSGDPKALMANTSPRSELLELLHLGPEESYLDLGAYRGKLGATLTVSPFCPMPAGMPKPP